MNLLIFSGNPRMHGLWKKKCLFHFRIILFASGKHGVLDVIPIFYRFPSHLFEDTKRGPCRFGAEMLVNSLPVCYVKWHPWPMKSSMIY